MNGQRNLSQESTERIDALIGRTARHLGYVENGEQTQSEEGFLSELFVGLAVQEMYEQMEREDIAGRIRSYFESEAASLITKGLKESEAMQVIEGRYAEAETAETQSDFLAAFEQFDTKPVELRKRVSMQGIPLHYAVIMPMCLLLFGYLGMRYANTAGLAVGVTAGFTFGLVISMLVHAAQLRRLS